MSTNKKKPAPTTKVDKRSKEYRDAHKKLTHKNQFTEKSRNWTTEAVHTFNTIDMETALKSGLVISASQLEDPTPWTVNNLMKDIRAQVEGLKYANSRLTACVNSVVYIERKVDDTKDKLTKRSDTVTDNLDDIKWQLNEISETYYNELDILERYIGNTNKV